ncbi:MAG: Ig-like domain-containing protein [Pseudomonadota bacterium]
MKCGHRIRSGLVGFLLPLTLSIGPTLAAEEACELVEVPKLAGCSSTTMLEALNEDLLITAPNAPEELYAEGRTPPGQAELTFSGLTKETGTACAQPIAALTSDGLLMSGALSGAEAKSTVTARAEKLEKRAKQMKGADSAGDQIEALMDLMGRSESEARPGGGNDFDPLNVLIPEDQQQRDVILEISSPNAFTMESGQLGNPISVKHSGATGWGPRAASHFVIQLPGTTPDKLQPGESYSAVALAPVDGAEPNAMPSLMAFYSSWEGRFQPFLDRERANPEGADILDDILQPDVSLPNGIRGLNLARMARSGEGFVFQGEITLVGGRMDGKVHIQEITEEAVYGQLELSGSGLAETQVHEFTYDREGKLDGSERTDTHTRSGPIKLTGSFEAPNRGSMVRMGYAAVTVDARGGERPPELTVTAHYPPGRARNVDRRNPDLEIHFDRRLAPDSVAANSAYIEYPNVFGEMVQIAANLRVQGDRLLIEPKDHLRPAAWHRVVIEGGSLGPQGTNGAQLPAAYDFTFATLPEEFEIEPHVFQVSKDAPLVAGKQTLTRLHVDWERPEHTVDEAWHVRKIPADAWVTDEREGLLYEKKEKTEVPIEELTGKAEKRRATNTVNFFGWQPRLRETQRVRGFIQPIDPCDRRLEEEEEGKRTVTWTDLQKDLTFDYYMMKVGSWADGVPPAARDVATRIAAKAEEFTEQTFPVTGATGRAAGDYTPSEDWRNDLASKLEKYDKAWANPLLDHDGQDIFHHYKARFLLLKELHDRLWEQGNVPDLVLALFPTDVMGGGTSFGTDKQAPDAQEEVWPPPIHFLMPFSLMETSRRAAEVPAVAHEFGHGFGLPHVPDVKGRTERAIECKSGRSEMAGIEGFRLALDEDSGFNKSFQEGNGESPHTLLPLMYPCARETAKHFILRDHYQRLLDTLERTYMSPSLPPPGSRTQAPSIPTGPDSSRLVRMLKPVSVASASQDGTQEETYVVSGWLDESGQQAEISHVSPVQGMTRTHGPEGDFTLLLRDAEGEVLARRSIGSALRDSQTGPFLALVSSPAPPDKVELRLEDSLLAERHRSSSAPEITAFDIREVGEDEVVVDWLLSDADGDPLSGSLLFRAADEEAWRVVVPRTQESRVTIPRVALPDGASPQFRLVVSDGMNRTERLLKATSATRTPPVREEPVDEQETLPPEPEPDRGPAPLAGEFVESQWEDSSEEVPDDSSQAVTEALQSEPEGKLVLEGQTHAMQITRCERKSFGPEASVIELSATSGPVESEHLSVKASIAELPQGAHQLVEARRVDADGQEGAVFMAMHSAEGDKWKDPFGAPVDGPLLRLEGTTLTGSGEFFDRTREVVSLGQGRFQAPCPGLDDE